MIQTGTEGIFVVQKLAQRLIVPISRLFMSILLAKVKRQTSQRSSYHLQAEGLPSITEQSVQTSAEGFNLCYQIRLKYQADIRQPPEYSLPPSHCTYALKTIYLCEPLQSMHKNLKIRNFKQLSLVQGTWYPNSWAIEFLISLLFYGCSPWNLRCKVG